MKTLAERREANEALLARYAAARRRRVQAARWVLRPLEAKYFGTRSDTLARRAAELRYPCCGQSVRLPHRLERLTARACRRCGRRWLVVRLTPFAELEWRGRRRLKWVAAPRRVGSGRVPRQDHS